MTPRSLQAVLRSLAVAETTASDRELLRRFRGGDEGAFAELVRRHGRLVWAVCRHVTGSDSEADDAFQATFLVLLRGAKKVRDASKLSAWLHGVAYKVCAKARRAAERRTARERAAAVSERNGSIVPDSAWDRALAAVHEEVAALPETLRVPFVLCCLEGKCVTEAAEQLGWKLGTFSGRLTRAKDVLVARLGTRGLTLGAVAGLGLISPPTTAVAKAAALARAGAIVPSSILQLTQGVIGMGMTSFKVLAVAVLLTCGLGLGLGTGWVSTADAQTKNSPPPPKADPEAEVKRFQAELEKARLAEQVRDARLQLDLLSAEALFAEVLNEGQKSNTAKTTKWEYDFVPVARDITQAKFVEFLQERENRGWEFNGMTTLRFEGNAMWIFRRPAKGANEAYLRLVSDYYTQLEKKFSSPGNEPDPGKGAKVEDAKTIEAEIARLQEKLATVKGKPTWSRVVFVKNELPVPPAELATLLVKLADRKFAKGRCSISSSENGIAVEGDKEVIEWVTELVKKLAEK